MPLVIPDETLKAAGMSEQEAKIAIACRWFDDGKLSIGHAAKLAALTVEDFELQLESRGLPRYRYTQEMLDRDARTLKKLEEKASLSNLLAECKGENPHPEAIRGAAGKEIF